MTAAAPAARVPGRAVPAKGGPLLKAGRLLVRTIASVLLAAAVATFLFLAVGPSFLGYQNSIVLSGSMAPTINPGDVVVTVSSPVSSLKTGDIITYRIPVQDRRIESLRIAGPIPDGDGSTTVRTRGDAKPDAADGSKNGADGAKTPAAG